MARGPIVTDAIEFLIASTYLKHPKWKAPEVRNEVSLILRKNNPKLPRSFPGLSSVQKVLSTYRKNENKLKDNPLDKPWSAASMAKYPFPAEALPSLLQLWVWRRENLNAKLTIRQALWASRFYIAIKKMEELELITRIFSFSEIIHERKGGTFENSSAIDLTIFGEMMGQEITKERKRKILGEEEFLADEALLNTPF